MEELSFDVVVCGTGITASIIAASLTIKGLKVLQIDSNNHYGDKYRTLDIRQLTSLQCSKELKDIFSPKGDRTEDTHLNVDEAGCGTRVLYKFGPFADDSMKDVMLKESNKYCIDLWPKLIYGKSAIVDLLLRFGCDSYLRFGCNNGPLLVCNEEDDEIKITEVPNNKSSIFRDKSLNPIEKRVLMKFINELSDSINTRIFTSDALKKTPETYDSQGGAYDIDIKEPDKLWIDYLKEKGLTDKLIKLISYGICLGGKDLYNWTKSEGILRLLKYMESIGTFGDSGGCFLYTLYGTADIIQALCRISAVHGCTFMLNKKIECIEGQRGKFNVYISGDIKVSTKDVIMEQLINGKESQATSTVYVLIAITEEPIIDGMNMLIVIPESESMEPIYILQTCCDNGTVPSGKYLIHLVTKDEVDVSTEVDDVVDPSSITENINLGPSTPFFRMQSVLKRICRDLKRVMLMVYVTHKVKCAKSKRDVSKDNEGVINVQSQLKSLIPIMDEVLDARNVVMRLLGGGDDDDNDDVYKRVNLEGFVDVQHKDGREDDEQEDKNLIMLDDIINKFS